MGRIQVLIGSLSYASQRERSGGLFEDRKEGKGKEKGEKAITRKNPCP